MDRGKEENPEDSSVCLMFLKSTGNQYSLDSGAVFSGFPNANAFVQMTLTSHILWGCVPYYYVILHYFSSDVYKQTRNLHNYSITCNKYNTSDYDESKHVYTGNSFYRL